MLEITVPAVELWDERKEQFIRTKERKLRLEHSLVSISKWESKWCKAFFSREDKTDEEVIDYVKCMTLTQNVEPEVYACLSKENIDQINEYIKAPMTATRLYEPETSKTRNENTTSDRIYSWMIALNIPPEYEKWHINRLLMLIRLCNAMNQPAKKMSRGEIMRRNADLNRARRQRMNSKG